MKTRILLALLLTIAALLGVLAWSHVRVAKTSVGDPHIESADAGTRSTEELSALPETPVSERHGCGTRAFVSSVAYSARTPGH